ncbi:MAG: hypothetical protein FJ319_02155 [SAR202 cluster bacterium]|nr:hypothetical protein [SAR202 cluster bacterium]
MTTKKIKVRDMIDRSAQAINSLTTGMTTAEEVVFWEERRKRLVAWQDQTDKAITKADLVLLTAGIAPPKKFDAVEMMHEAQSALSQQMGNKTAEEEIAYWRERDQARKPGTNSAQPPKAKAHKSKSATTKSRRKSSEAA